MTTNENLCAPSSFTGCINQDMVIILDGISFAHVTQLMRTYACLAVLQAVSIRPSRPAIQWKKNSGGWIPAKDNMKQRRERQERRERLKR